MRGVHSRSRCFGRVTRTRAIQQLTKTRVSERPSIDRLGCSVQNRIQHDRKNRDGNDTLLASAVKRPSSVPTARA
jgi:hypothetical protein